MVGIKENLTEKVKGEIEKMGREVITAQMSISEWEDVQRMAKNFS